MVIFYVVIFLLSIHIHSFGMSGNAAQDALRYGPISQEEANNLHKSSLQRKCHELEKKIQTTSQALARVRTELAGLPQVIAQAPQRIQDAQRYIETLRDGITTLENNCNKDIARVSKEHNHNHQSDHELSRKIEHIKSDFEKRKKENVDKILSQQEEIIAPNQNILNNQQALRRPLERLITTLLTDIQDYVAEQEAIQKDIEELSPNIYLYEEKNNKDKKQLVVNPPHLGYNITALGVIGLLYKLSHRSHYMSQAIIESVVQVGARIAFLHFRLGDKYHSVIARLPGYFATRMGVDLAWRYMFCAPEKNKCHTNKNLEFDNLEKPGQEEQNNTQKTSNFVHIMSVVARSLIASIIMGTVIDADVYK